MNMLWRMVEPKYVANSVIARAVGSAYTDLTWRPPLPRPDCPGPCTAEPMRQFLNMLDEIGSKANVPAYINKVKDGHGKLMGFWSPRL